MPKPNKDSDFNMLFGLLREDVCKKIKNNLHPNQDFADLAVDVKKHFDSKNQKTNMAIAPNHINATISERTLRDWWQLDESATDYKKDVSPYLNSLSIISEYATGLNWRQYCEEKRKQLRLFDPKDCIVEKMEVEKNYIIGWRPIYYVELKYLGKNEFLVLSSSPNVKLKPGDKKVIYGFGIGYPVTFPLFNLPNVKNINISGYPLYPAIYLHTTDPNNEEIILQESIAEDHILFYVENSEQNE